MGTINGIEWVFDRSLYERFWGEIAAVCRYQVMLETPMFDEATGAYAWL